MKTLLFIPFFFFLSQKPGNAQGKVQDVRIDISAADTISEKFYKNRLLIPLETTADNRIQSVSQLRVTDNEIIVSSIYDQCIQVYQLDGKFIAQFKPKSNSKTRYALFNFSFDPLKKVIVVNFGWDGIQQIYNLKGEKIKERQIESDLTNIYFLDDESRAEIYLPDPRKGINSNDTTSKNILYLKTKTNSKGLLFTGEKKRFLLSRYGTFHSYVNQSDQKPFYFTMPFDLNIYELGSGDLTEKYKIILPYGMGLEEKDIDGLFESTKSGSPLTPAVSLKFKAIDGVSDFGKGIVFSLTRVASNTVFLLYEKKSGITYFINPYFLQGLDHDISSSEPFNIDLQGGFLYSSVDAPVLAKYFSQQPKSGFKIPEKLNNLEPKQNPIIVRISPSL